MSPLAHAAIALCAVAIVVSYALLGRGVVLHRRILYLGMRTLAALLLLAALIAPDRTTDEPLTRRHDLALAFDASKSMALPAGSADARSRAESLRRFLAAHELDVSAIAERYNLRTYRFASEVTRTKPPADGQRLASPEPSGHATCVGDAVIRALDDARGRPLAGVVVFSDGASNIGATCAAAGAESARTGTPVHTIAVGGSEPIRDIAVTDLDVPGTATVGRPVRITAVVRARHVRTKTTTVTVIAGGKEIQRRVVPLRGREEVVRIAATVTPGDRGSLVVEAFASPVAGEAIVENNRRLAFVDVEDTTLRVLYVEGTLRRDFGRIRRALGAAAGVEVDVERAFIRGKRLAPDRWEQYDVFVLGEVADDAVAPGAFDLVERQVSRRGRGLVVFAGPTALSSGRLSRLVPLRVSGGPRPNVVAVRPAPSAHDHPAIRIADRSTNELAAWSRMRPLGDVPQSASVASGADLLLKAPDGRPVLAAGRLGTGRAAVLASGQTHVWADDPSAPRGAYRRLIRSLVTWAAGRESSRALLSVRLGRHMLHKGDVVSIAAHVNRARARELGFTEKDLDSLRIQARIVGPVTSGSIVDAAIAGRDRADPFRLEPRFGGYAGTARAGRPGAYALSVEPVFSDARMPPATTAFVVQGDDREFESLQATPAELRMLSKMTRGIASDTRSGRRVWEALLSARSETTARARRTVTLWDRWWVLSGALLLLLAEWWMRRR